MRQLRVSRLLALLCLTALLCPACSGRAALAAVAAGAAVPHLDAVPDWSKALKLRSMPPEVQQAAAAAAAVAAHRDEGERAAAVAALLAAESPPSAPTHPLSPPLAMAEEPSGQPRVAADTAAASPPPTPSEAVVREAETDEDGIGSNGTRAAADASDWEGSDAEKPISAAAVPPAAPDAALAAALDAHAAAAALYAEEVCPGCAAGGGNCDMERRSCDCPLGRAGPACATLFVGYVTPCGGHLTSCACLAACAAELRVGLDWFNGETCVEVGPPRSHDGAPLPAEAALLDAYFAGLQRRADRVGDPYPVAPSVQCGEARCCNRGVCQGADRACACLPGGGGPGCTPGARVPPCLNGCSGRGACVAEGTVYAWCRCQPGFWGVDCALSRQQGDTATRLFSRLPYSNGTNSSDDDDVLRLPPPAVPPVYVYHLPPRCGAYWAPYGIDRPVAEMLHERLAASAHRVADGAAAALFYVPLPLRKMQKAAAAAATSLDCIAELSRAFPHVNATGGGRGHLLVTASDAGPAEAWRATWQAQGLPPAVREWTLLTHHGAMGSGVEGDPPLFRRGRDLLLPPLQGRATGFEAAASPLLGRAKGSATPARNVTLFWAGAVSRAKSHAARNMRAAVYDRFRDEPGFVLTDTASAPPAPAGAYGALFAAARFCLAPAGKGGGWGRRATLAALHGCVPVLLQDATADALEDLLDWNTFSVRIDEGDVEDLPAVLAAISERRLRQMQTQLACAVPRWLYSSIIGAAAADDDDDDDEEEDGGDDAVASMLQALHRRALRAAGEPGAMPAAPCALRRARRAAGCVGEPLPLESEERGVRPQPTPWPAGGAACVGAEALPCALPRGVPQRCATDSAAAAGFLVTPPAEWNINGSSSSESWGGEAGSHIR